MTVEVDPRLHDHALGLELQIVEVVHQAEVAADRVGSDEEMVLQAELDELYDELATVAEDVADQVPATSASTTIRAGAAEPARDSPAAHPPLGPGQRVRSADLRRSVVELSMQVKDDDALVVLRHVVELAERSVGSCDGAAVTVINDEGASTTVASATMAHRLNTAQYLLGEGPGPDAVRHLQAFRVDSLADGEMWPEFSRLAVDNGILSTLSVPLVVGGDVVGTLDLYSRLCDGLLGCEQLGTTLAGRAALAVAGRPT